MIDDSDGAGEAELDPWCLVLLEDGEEVLFGYGVRHPVLAGMSWMSSTPIVELDAEAGRAITRSGRRYRLGRPVPVAKIPQEGEEAWVAFDLLLGGSLDDPTALPPRVADPQSDRDWLASCKAARHLGITPPSRTPWEVREFMERHLAAYMGLRRWGKPDGSA